MLKLCLTNVASIRPALSLSLIIAGQVPGFPSLPPLFIMVLRLTSLRAAVALLALSSLAACSKKNEDTPAPLATAQSMNWTVDGANVTASSATADASGSNINVVGGTSTGTSMGVSVPKRTGTFGVGSTGADAATTVYGINVGTTPTTFVGKSGTVVVTTYSPSTTAGASNIVGTFSFTGENFNTYPTSTSKVITNGTFNVKY